MQTKKFLPPKWMIDQIADGDTLSDSELFKFNIKFANGTTATVELMRDLDIDYELLEYHLETVPAQYMFWAAIYSELKANVTVLEIQLDKRKTFVASTTIKKFRGENVRLTDKQMQAIIDSDDGLDKIRVALVIAQKKCGKVYHMVEAIKLKSENCRSLAGFKRQEKEQSSQTT